MAKKQNRHVTQRPDGSWANKIEGADRASSLHDTQAEAQKSARESLQKNSGGELITHGTDGKIRQKNTIPPAKDPYPPEG